MSETMTMPVPATTAAPLSLWDRLSLTLVHRAAGLMLSLLTLPGFYRFGRWFGTLEWLINYKRRRRFRKALKSVLGEVPAPRLRRRLTREVFMQTRCDKLLYLVIDRLDRAQADSLLTITHREKLDEACSRGRGVYIALSHQGAHHVIAMLMALKGYKTAGVRDRKESAMRRFVQQRFDSLYPEFSRMRVIYADSLPRDIYRCFREQYLLGSAIDVHRKRHDRQKAEEVPFLGRERAFLTGPIRIAIRCKAPILQAFILPEKNFRYRLAIAGTLVDPEKETEGEDELCRRAIREYAANVESHLREHPSLISRF